MKRKPIMMDITEYQAVMLRKGLSLQRARIAELAALGLTTQDIAEEFGLSRVTIKFHMTRIYRLLKIKTKPGSYVARQALRRIGGL